MKKKPRINYECGCKYRIRKNGEFLPDWLCDYHVQYYLEQVNGRIKAERKVKELLDDL